MYEVKVFDVRRHKSGCSTALDYVLFNLVDDDVVRRRKRGAKASSFDDSDDDLWVLCFGALYTLTIVLCRARKRKDDPSARQVKEAQKRKNERQHIVYDRKGDFGFMVMTVRYVFSSPSTAEIYRILMGLSHDDDDVVVGGGGIFYDSYFRRIILFFSESSRCAFSQKKKNVTI